MRTFSFAILFLLVLCSCKDSKNQGPVEAPVDYSEAELDLVTSVYPESISKVFQAHGGLESWQKMRTLEFTMPDESGDEVTLTDLWNRSSRIDMPNHTIGFDGETLWLKSMDTTSYKGNARFYYNLMFYFYAMPFILADDGIIYEVTDPLKFEDKNYPGIKISYESGVGESPEDEYILYYDPETFKMTWLGYTVTYFTKEKSKEFHFIKYSDWQDVNGLILPKTISWYNYENNVPTTKRSDLEFTNIILSDSKSDPQKFERPEGAEVIE